ncbi:unnamed protein product [Effrenium voratum]|uniref:Uncharacterized protein n=1 Tax=Effrenium voratum TaxID=2562239 RepID=A0AA36ICL5_9DINO|nr:unnamed protein product [Effrenium voratum]CAJ1417780.1 unnamed protein product [Effrenium voratum]
MAMAKPGSAQPKAPKARPKFAAPKPWPPKVPLGELEDILPLVEANDESIDAVMLPPDLGDGFTAEAFGPKEVEYLCQRLENNTSVTQLNLSMNPLGDEGAAHVAALLARPGLPLARLSLNGCGIGAQGARHLASALAERPELSVVELMNNRLGAEGGEAILEALSKNKKLREVKVSFSSIPESIETKIEKILMTR